ncbi:hypothetical protein M0R19_06265 [Candidatus Pacearchaeota archaeon]|jgi:hypothetical protein|nr:hypothetical protein [Candidatus Pacearchaeota archaeon]
MKIRRVALEGQITLGVKINSTKSNKSLPKMSILFQTGDQNVMEQELLSELIFDGSINKRLDDIKHFINDLEEIKHKLLVIKSARY